MQVNHQDEQVDERNKRAITWWCPGYATDDARVARHDARSARHDARSTRYDGTTRYGLAAWYDAWSTRHDGRSRYGPAAWLDGLTGYGHDWITCNGDDAAARHDGITKMMMYLFRFFYASSYT